MAASVPADAGFVVALLSKSDRHHDWAVSHAANHPTPWKTCEAALSEAFVLLGTRGAAITALMRREALVPAFSLADDSAAVLALMQKYKDVPMSLADACLVRMTETLPDPVLLTTDGDLQIYRRHGRKTVPCVLP